MWESKYFGQYKSNDINSFLFSLDHNSIHKCIN